MLQAPSPFTSQTVGWLYDATAHCRRPTSNCAITRASPMFTTPSPFTSPQMGGVVVVVVVLVVVVVVVDDVVGTGLVVVVGVQGPK